MSPAKHVLLGLGPCTSRLPMDPPLPPFCTHRGAPPTLLLLTHGVCPRRPR